MSGNSELFNDYWNADAAASYSGRGPVSNSESQFEYKSDDLILNTDTLNFHQSNFDPTQSSSYGYDQPVTRYGYQPNEVLLNPEQRYDSDQSGFQQSYDFDDEPPLLEELGIDPNQIMKKILVVLDPFCSSVPIGDYDLAGPLAFCIALAGFLLLSGGKAHFGYVYGLAVTSCLVMYCLLSLMTSTHMITLTSVASVLGYALLPVVFLSAVGVFFTLRSVVGLVLSLIVVLWSSLAASRIFVTMSADREQRPLIAYPCALLYAVFALLVIF